MSMFGSTWSETSVSEEEIRRLRQIEKIVLTAFLLGPNTTPRQLLYHIASEWDELDEEWVQVLDREVS